MGWRALCSRVGRMAVLNLPTLMDLLCRTFSAVDELRKNNAILVESLKKSFQQVETLRDQMAHKQMEIERINVLLVAERSMKPHEPRTIRPRTAAEMRRLVEHQNAEEMEQEAV